MPSYIRRQPSFIGHFADSIHHEPEDVRSRRYPDCRSCLSQREHWSITLRRTRRAAQRNMVECEHQWSACLHRDDLNLIPSQGADYCEECGGHFCPEHHHSNPSVVGRRDCYHCGRVARCLETYACNDCMNHYCDSCHNNGHNCDSGGDYESSSSEFNIGQPVQLLFNGEVGSHPWAMGARYVGFELEVEEGVFCEIPREFGIEEDGSIQGIEILTPPARGSYLVEQTRNIMRILSDAGWEGTQSCGMHTHIDLRDKREDMVFLSRLFATAFAVEDVLYSTQHEDRHLSSYSIPLRQGYKFFDGYGMKATDFEFVYNKLDKSVDASRQLEDGRRSKWGNRYYGFNFHSVFHRGTLEVRIHEGSLDPQQALLWAELLQSLVARVEKGVNYRILRRLLEMEPTPAKAKTMRRYFSLSDEVYQWMLGHIKRRADRGRQIHLRYSLGTPRRGKTPSLTALQRVIDERLPTHWQCSECAHHVPVLLSERQIPAYHPTWCTIRDMLSQRPGFPYMARLHAIDPETGEITLIGNARRVIGAGRTRQGRFISEQMSMWDRWVPAPEPAVVVLDEVDPVAEEFWFTPGTSVQFEPLVNEPAITVRLGEPITLTGELDDDGNPVSESEF